jgi:hypothetical protein
LSNRFIQNNVVDFDYYDAESNNIPVKSVIKPLYINDDISDNVFQSHVYDSDSDQVGIDCTNLHALDSHRMRTLKCSNAEDSIPSPKIPTPVTIFGKNVV